MSNLQLIAGYGPYHVDGNGVPLLNEVVWDFLGHCDTSAEEFGQKLGRLTRPNHKPYTKGRIYQMLDDNSFPDQKPRRWVIAKLLQIPPALMGVESLDELLIFTKHKPKSSVTQIYRTIPPAFDMQEYHHALKNYWLIDYTNTAIGEIDQRIVLLEQEILYGEKKGKGKRTERETLPLVHLLCEYHILFSNIARDQEYYDPAIRYLNKAHRLAKNYELADTQAAILCRRGGVFDGQGRSYENALDLNTARKYFSWAKDDFLAAQVLKDKLYAGLRGYTHVGFGLAASHLASNPYELHQAIIEIQKAQNFVGKDADREDTYFVRLDEERYHLDLASAYINAPVEIACYPKDARRELRNACAARTNPYAKRRQAFGTVLRAKSYLLEKEYEESTTKFLEALGQARAINSKENIARINASCNKLVTTDYGKKSVKVGELEATLMTLHHPELFY